MDGRNDLLGSYKLDKLTYRVKNVFFRVGNL